MSLQAMNWVLQDLANVDALKPAEKWLLMVMADHADVPSWSFFHGHEKLARNAGMSRRTVVTMMAKFEEMGLIRRLARFRWDGTRTTDLISLLGSENPALGALPGADYGLDQVQKRAPKEAKVAQHNREEQSGKVIDKAADASLSDEAAAFAHWNVRAGENGWAKATVFNGERRSKLKARIKEAGGLDGWKAWVDDIRFSPFLMGLRPGRHGPFAISLDFILQPSSWAKIMEGFYHRDRATNLASGGGGSRHEERRSAFVAGALASVDQSRRERGWPGGS